MKVLLLGARGFIGKNLSIYLSKDYLIKQISLRDADWEKEALFGDVFINLVGKAHDHEKKATEADFYHANLELAMKSFQVFKDSSAKLFIHISSLAALEEYESNEPLTEDAICHPSSWYGKSKHAAEEWLLAQEIPKDKRLIILRPPMVHGPGDKGNLKLLFNFVEKGIPYPLIKFKNERSFIGIENFCFFIGQVIQKFNSMQNGIFHIADDEPLSTSDILQIIEEVTDRKVFNIGIPKYLIILMAKIGDFMPFPLNSKRLKKMTGTLLVANNKIKEQLKIEMLPITTREGMIKTIESFSKE
ncbi:NAD-dependent epimerase/dehydratase family protein [Sphingobacterium siyangense]|uniref:NAD-dependent epimerase/dehydratase family protein n=1 Tax=Sphingobacterium siyangense TaxID=459529 RepID=UPI002FDCBBC1